MAALFGDIGHSKTIWLLFMRRVYNGDFESNHGDIGETKIVLCIFDMDEVERY